MNIKSTKTKEQFLAPADFLTKNNTENCILEEGKLRARPGVFARSEEWIFDNYSNLEAKMSLIVTDCFLYVGGKYCRVVVSVSDNETGNVEYNMRLVFADGTVRDIGRIDFTRASFDAFGEPESFTVFSGRATRGCGIYFISRQIYGSGEDDFVRILELSEDMKNWRPVSDTDIYSPTILANGRGDAYHLAYVGGDPLKLKEPVYPESRNLLCGSFSCYFTADSASASFFLPYTGLDSSALYGEYTNGDKKYSFKIEAGSNESEEIEISNEMVKLICNRPIGKVRFKRADGTDWAPPYNGCYNNLKFRAFKTYAEDRVKVAAMSACHRIDGDMGRVESKRTVFYKNGISPAAVMVNSQRHPLYFPENAMQIMGESELPLCGMVMRERSLVAFKENEVYSADVSGFEDEKDFTPSALGEKAASSKDKIVFQREASLPAAPCEKTVAVLGGDIFFLSKSGDIMRIQGRGGSAHSIEKIGNAENFSSDRAFAVTDRGCYLLCDEDRVWAVKREDKEHRFFLWRLPERVANGFTYLDKAVLFAELDDGDAYFVYPTLFSGNEDCKMVAEGAARRLEKVPLTAEIKPEIWQKSPFGKRILAVKFSGETCGARQILPDDNLRSLVEREGSASINIPFYAGEERLKFRFSAGFRLGGISVLYRDLNKL